MSNKKFTPGPWVLNGDDKKIGHYIAGPYDTGICEFHRKEYSEANANLIAAAPDMYEALGNIVKWLEDSNTVIHSSLLSKIEAALSKANP